MQLLKTLGIEIVDESSEEIKLSPSNILVIIFCELLIGVGCLVFGGMKLMHEPSFSDLAAIRYMIIISWGVFFALVGIESIFFYEFAKEIQEIKIRINRVLIDKTESLSGYYRKKKPAMNNIHIDSEKCGLWEIDNDRICMVSEAAFERLGEEVFLAGIWNEDSPEKIEYKFSHKSLYDMYLAGEDAEKVFDAENESKDLAEIDVIEKYGEVCKKICHNLERRLLEDDIYAANDIQRMAGHWNK